MDAATRAMVDYACDLSDDAVPPAAVHAVVRHVIDSIACAIGAVEARPCTIARRLAATAGGDYGATVIGSSRRSTPEWAAFANTVMIRYLDYNDTGIGGHPSDMIPSMLALAEAEGCSGRKLVQAIYVAYEVVAELRRAGFYRLRKRHVDQVQSVLGSAVGSGVVLQLDREQLANAIALAITPSIPLRVVRTGQLSDWKGCATAHASMNAVFAARCAREGLTGPPEPFDGVAGFCDLLGLDPLRLDRLGAPCEGLTAIECTGLKYYPSEYSSQGPIALLLALRPEFDLDRLESVTVALHWGGWHEIGGGQGDRQEKWHPTTRESADHSMAYLAAAALLDGEITLSTFDRARLADPALRRLMDKVEVIEDPALTADHAGELPKWPSWVEIRLRNGSILRRHTRYPKGHPRNPLTDQEVENKFLGLCEPQGRGGDCRRLLDLLWDLDAQPDLDGLMQLLRDLPGARP